MTSGLAHISRERPIHHRQVDSPEPSPRVGLDYFHQSSILKYKFQPDNNDDDTQEGSDSDPPSSQIANGAIGQKEYKPADADAYDPKMYQDLPVSAEVKDVFKYIEKYWIIF
jgi:hypothetical protein